MSPLTTTITVAAMVFALEPCCSVVAVDTVKGVATLKDLKTGKAFTVTVSSKAALRKLRVGQKVDRNL